MAANMAMFAALLFVTFVALGSQQSQPYDPEAVERLLHRKNNAVLEQTGLGSQGTKLALVGRDDDDSPFLASYSWTIDAYESRNERRLDSPVFRAAATLWQLMLYPQGDDGHKGYISLYIGATLAPHWGPHEAVHSSWRFTVLNARGTRPHIVQEANHNFSRFSTNWGFNKLTLRSSLLDPAEGWLDEHSKLQLRVDVRHVEPYWVDYAGIERQHFDTVRSSVALWSEMQGLGVKDLMVTYSITDDGHSR
ncbi:hypothetical protein GPECTOR_10g920 [Gonium pectorale]|uniref:MATH domain-containing protein n=1 Tax=Gonium pectorale TaxID=33097 RepID=A0A150GRC7_GONPE|nr:hypothetical protein GPECTOR_10g920 [Gonium pectorale]|eukprot:KXZ52288.1 hypothetical protein GPECTOR_10g920 [Gonium pectorale]